MNVLSLCNDLDNFVKLSLFILETLYAPLIPLNHFKHLRVSHLDLAFIPLTTVAFGQLYVQVLAQATQAHHVNFFQIYVEVLSMALFPRIFLLSLFFFLSLGLLALLAFIQLECRIIIDSGSFRVDDTLEADVILAFVAHEWYLRVAVSHIWLAWLPY